MVANHAPTQEDLLKAWFKHYHDVIRSGSFEFVAPEDLALLWKIVGNNALYAVPRSSCQGLSAQQTAEIVTRERTKLILENKPRIAASLAQAVAKELQCKQHPQAGDRRPDEVNRVLVMQSFQKVKTFWSKEDQTILQEAFSYRETEQQRTAAEQCDRNWLVSRAIADSVSQDVPVLLESITKSKYAMFFSGVDTPFAMSRPTPLGFVPGKESVYYPELPLRKRVQGTTTARISVDEAGNVTEVKIVDDALVPASVTSGDGRVLAARDLFHSMLLKYFKDGKFPAQSTQGKPTVFDLPFAWQLQ